MPVPRAWANVLQAPTFVINLDLRPERLAASVEEIERAGFREIWRFPAVDARDPEMLAEAWAACGSPRFADWNPDFQQYPGRQGCFLSHLAVWQQIVDFDLPFACVFEDDVIFHRHWEQLAPTCFDFTPPNYDLLYMGNQRLSQGVGLVLRAPVYCTHAYLITREGARRLRSLLLDDPHGVATIDMMLGHYQWREQTEGTPAGFDWYVWNGTTFGDPRAGVDPVWAWRNSGLVFQDHLLGTDVTERSHFDQFTARA